MMLIYADLAVDTLTLDTAADVHIADVDVTDVVTPQPRWLATFRQEA